uniref:bifunctional riboflavin kinase/FAD synthetase n=1 Tax=Acetatifactor sp. TaxID=1872090 RepID=UPI0040563B58
MKIIVGTTEFVLEKETAVAIGKFDGVHIGHRRLLEEILAQKEKGLLACVFTFDPPPAVLFGHSDGKELTTREEKRKLFEKVGVDILIEFPLSFDTAAILPEDFAREILAKRMKARFIAAGTDLSFGAKGAGNATLLQKLSLELGFEVKTIEKVCMQGTEVNSTYIREQLKAGDMELVEKFLGMPYTVMGTVKHGNRIGRTIGFPTVNLLPQETKLLPPNGVYYSEVLTGGKRYRAISNIGYKPTVTEEQVMGVESYLYDFNEEIYDETVEVYLYAFKRPEQRFGSLEELKSQLQKDIKDGRNFCK